MRALVSVASLVCCFAASDPTLLQQGVDVGNRAKATSGFQVAGRRRTPPPPGYGFNRGGCFTLGTPKLPGKIFSFEACPLSAIKSWISASASGATVSVTGQLNFPCGWFACAPTSGSITIEKTLGGARSKNKAKVDNDHGDSKEGVFTMDGVIGASVTIAKANASGGGADITVSVYGAVEVTALKDLINARGSISGMIKFYNLRFSPLGWSSIGLRVEVKLTVRVFFATFSVAVALSTDGGWTVTVKLGDFFGVGNCYQKNWMRRRHWCDSYPRRRNHLMNQWCWGKTAWNTCGKNTHGSTPYPGCRLLGLHPMCYNDQRRRRRTRRRRRRYRRRRDRRRRYRRRRDRRRRRYRRRRDRRRRYRRRRDRRRRTGRRRRGWR